MDFFDGLFDRNKNHGDHGHHGSHEKQHGGHDDHNQHQWGRQTSPQPYQAAVQTQSQTGPSCCGVAIPIDARFCSQCGSAVKRSLFCPGCRQTVIEGAKFCQGCGQALG